jgi:multicomponent Na+:H+ antiporter subunit A
MLYVVLAGLVFALLVPQLVKAVPSLRYLLWVGLPLGLLGYFVAKVPAIAAGETIRESTAWVPSLGANLSFVLDGLSLMFAVMITSIGALVFFYTKHYMKDHREIDRFYAYLSFFMASMLGLVLSDSLMLMFIFWELTSISSFFLIGFNNKEEASRKAALVALGITGFGGMALLAAAVLVGQATGSYSLEALYAYGPLIHQSGAYTLIVVFIFLAAFTKSAQFPFHFWLPGAMKAPTPVSTYLHSATMVKAGIFLLLRFSPSLGGTALWNEGLMLVGGFTMLYSVVTALFKTDLKAILAYTTISALGMLTFLIGIGTEVAMAAALIFIFVHALYKAALFLVTGIIDHAVHSRDVTQLRGLRRVMAPVAIAALLAALSSAGLPGTFGFIGKELIYEGSLDVPQLGILLTGLALLTNVFLLHAGFVAGIKPFTGKLPEAFAKIQAPSPLLWGAPMLLGLVGVTLGIFPGLLEPGFIHPALHSLGFAEAAPHLKLWHGFNMVLLLSVITLVLGCVIYLILKPSQRLESALNSLSRISPEAVFTGLANAFYAFSSHWTRLFQNGLLRYYVLMVLSVLLLLVAMRLGGAISVKVDFASLLNLSIYEIAIAILLLLGITITVFTPSRLAAVVSMGVVGYAICLFFVFYSAPDLAMTQFLIDTLTVILFVLVLYKLPRYLKLSDWRSRIRDGIFATAFGVVIGLIALEAINERTNKATSEYYAENAYLLAKGKNIVNVILVDFRGSDTMIEIVVLSVAAVGVYSLLKLRLRKSDTL